VRGAEAHHLVDVLRARPQDPVTVLDGRGTAWQGSIERISGHEVQVRLHRAAAAETAAERVLLCGLIRSARWDWLIEKATELGVTRIVPLLSERSHRLAPGQQAAKRARWERLAGAACKQSGRTDRPVIESLHLLRDLGGLTLPTLRLLLSAGASMSLRQLAIDHQPGGIALAIGPEGSFTPDEEQELISLGFQAVRLGSRILRTETAAIAALGVFL
jgi:16S rRNA (uracil1498-N3)-methyltransferase